MAVFIPVGWYGDGIVILRICQNWHPLQLVLELCSLLPNRKTLQARADEDTRPEEEGFPVVQLQGPVQLGYRRNWQHWEHSDIAKPQEDLLSQATWRQIDIVRLTWVWFYDSGDEKSSFPKEITYSKHSNHDTVSLSKTARLSTISSLSRFPARSIVSKKILSRGSLGSWPALLQCIILGQPPSLP